MTAEIDIARPIVAYFQTRGWEVYQEVNTALGRCDIVATQGPILVAVEVKASWSLAVFEQADRWIGQAHFSYIAVPRRKRWKGNILDRFARFLGVGVLVVGHHTCSQIDEEKVQEAVKPRFCRRIGSSVRNRLDEAQKTYAEAGNAESRFWSPFKQTCGAIRDQVRSGPKPFREVIAAITHHYRNDSTARSSMARWIETGRVEGVRMRRDGKALIVEATGA